MEKDEFTIRKLNNTKFCDLYEKFILDKDIGKSEYVYILSLATLFLNCDNENIQHLGYRIVVIYCNRFNDYKPLYEVANNLGLIPISQFIENIYKKKEMENFYTEFNSAINQTFFVKNIYYSIQQKKLVNFYGENADSTVSVVAPTSYGKTDLILETIEKCVQKNICVITPTKSLLAQTKMRIMQSGIKWVDKIITHPEMYNGKEKNIVAIVTQERLFRMLNKSENLKFDYVIIDEAHGLLHDDERNILLASVILLLEKRNSNTTFKFLTPFLCDPNNVKVRYADYKITTFEVNEYIKTEKIYLADMRNEKKEYYLYDQFLNKFFPIQTFQDLSSEWNFIVYNSKQKNIIYLNKPKDIEKFVYHVCREYEVVYTDKIAEACKNIAEYVHPKYRMIDCLGRGIIYHHGSVPEPIRMYVESLYSELKEIKYVVTSSTLLEGVNLPAESMFILDNKKGRGALSPADFKNLIGRVCRFSQIFNIKSGSLQRLEPCIYMVVGKYYSVNANVQNFLKQSMNVEKRVEDSLDNVLLENTEINDNNVDRLDAAEEFIENCQDGIIKDYDLRKVKTETGKSCFANNVNEFDIFDNEEEIHSTIMEYKNNRNIVDDTKELFNVLYELFFRRTDSNNIKRFEHEETRNFYKMFMDWRVSNTSLNYMVSSFVFYWKSIVLDTTKENYVYVGSRWGDHKRGGFAELWTDVSKKTDSELVNLAIVRIKEEQDFLDNTVIKFIEILNDMEIIEEEFYLKIKYGTNDKRAIVCVKNGISNGLAKILIERYIEYLHIDLNNDTIQFKKGLIDEMEINGENKVMICEMKYFL